MQPIFTVLYYSRLRRVDAHGDGSVDAAQWRRQGAARDGAGGGPVAATGLADGRREEARAQEVTASRLPWGMEEAGVINRFRCVYS